MLLLLLLSLSDLMQCSELCSYVVGWKADVFNWQDYLSHCSAEAAPTDAFTKVCNFVTLVVVVIGDDKLRANCRYHPTAARK